MSESGIWLSASSTNSVPDHNQNGSGLGPEGYGDGNGRQQPGMPWWRTAAYQGRFNDVIHSEEGWHIGAKAVSAVVPLISRQPNTWSSESVLLPIQPHVDVAESKKRMLADLVHARYIRIDYYEPEDIITLGEDRWRVYPGYRKNANGRDYGGQASGTFGWAVRYDGP